MHFLTYPQIDKKVYNFTDIWLSRRKAMATRMLIQQLVQVRNDKTTWLHIRGRYVRESTASDAFLSQMAINTESVSVSCLCCIITPSHFTVLDNEDIGVAYVVKAIESGLTPTKRFTNWIRRKELAKAIKRRQGHCKILSCYTHHILSSSNSIQTGTPKFESYLTRTTYSK